MKKHFPCILVAITLLFAMFLLGYFFGRNTSQAQILISTAAYGAPVVVTTDPTHSTMSSQPTFPININTATAQELTVLPGIGDVLAGRIVAYREEYGAFVTLEELMDVPGISEKKFDGLKDLICLGGNT